ncbi:MAG: radical SAM protein [Elusimicrobiales bacterium]|nr:radical SAM protein [Elusimicrobiales bacterium]
MFSKWQDRAALWLTFKFTRLWFSQWRPRVIVPVLRSDLFRRIFGIGGAGEPAAAQLLLQRMVVRCMRNPDIMLPLFRRVLRVCLTYNCNLSCKACYARGLAQEMGGDMTLENFGRVVEHCRLYGWRRLRFLGGEPTINPNFTDILDLSYRNGFEVAMPTNNLYSDEVARKFDPRFVRDVAINYSAYFNMDAAKKARFRKNLEYLRSNNIPFSFSYILEQSHGEEEMRTLYADLKEYLPLYIRVSLELPAFSDQNSAFVPSDVAESFFDRVYGMLQSCVKSYVPFFLYRPVPMCLFSPEQRRKLEKYSKFIFFSRCPLTYTSDSGYGMMLTVNPDLSTYPCASVFIKGPNFLTLKGSYAIHQYFGEKLHAPLCAPLTEACRSCGLHARFLDSVNRKDPLAPEVFDDKEMCQGGCINLRCHEAAGHMCHHQE